MGLQSITFLIPKPHLIHPCLMRLLPLERTGTVIFGTARVSPGSTLYPVNGLLVKHTARCRVMPPPDNTSTPYLAPETPNVRD